MRKSNNVRFGAFLGLMAVAFSASALDIKGVRIGMSMDELTQSFPNGSAEPGDAALNGVSCITADFCDVNVGTIAGIPASLLVTFRDGKIADAYIGKISPAEFDGVVAALREKFGPPTQSSSGYVQTKIGAKFDNPQYVWKRSDGFVFAARYFPGAPTIANSQIEISSLAWVAAKTAKEKARTGDL